MPLYDFGCEPCDILDERYLSISEHEAYLESHQAGDSNQRCPLCEGPMRTVITPVPTTGITPSKPLYVSGLDRTFHTNAELRAYEKANPNVHIHSTNDGRHRDHMWRARNGAERMAKGQGYRSWGHRQEQLSTEKGRMDLTGGVEPEPGTVDQ